MTYLVDTNVLSELRKGSRCDPGVGEWFAGVSDAELFVSVLTLGEIRRGVESIRRRDRKSAALLARWVEELASSHGERVIPVDRAVAEEWGRLSVPDPVPVIEGLLGATAIVYGMTLVTRNTADIARVGVSCVNPFAG